MKNFLKKLVQSLTDICGRLYKKYIIHSKWKEVVQQSNGNEEVIVSLTTYQRRFEDVKFAIKSLGFQTQKANRVILYIDDYEDNNIVVKNFSKIEKYGVEIIRVPDDLKPHKKYYFAMKSNPEAIIITIDDDCVYWPWTISSLLKTHKKYPQAVCARRVSKITYDENGNIKPYNSWQQSYMKELEPSSQLIATGVGGVLYPPHILPSETFDIDAIKKYCYGADDIWLKVMETMNHVDVVWTKCLLMHPIDIEESNDGLAALNVGANRNDAYLRDTLEAYNLSANEFKID